MISGLGCIDSRDGIEDHPITGEEAETETDVRDEDPRHE